MISRTRETRRIRILFVLNSFGTGGSERVVLDICRGIDRSRFEPQVVSLFGGELAGAFTEEGIWNEWLEKGRGIDFGLMRRIGALVREREIDLVNAHHFSPFIHACGGLRLKSNRLIYTDHTVREIRHVSRPWALVARLMLKRCYGISGISSEVAEAMKRRFHVPDRKVTTIPNAIDLDRFQGREDQGALRRELEIPAECRVVGVVGNLRPQKNHEGLLRAFRILLDTGVQARLLIIGDGVLRNRLEELRDDLEMRHDVLFLGARHDIPALYRIMDAYCLSSHYEGLPLTILEAMASGIPVVGTDVDGIREIIEPKTTGVLTDPTPESIAEGILYLFNHPDESRAIAKGGLRYVQRMHAMGPWIKSYERLFETAWRRLHHSLDFSDQINNI